MFRAQVSSVFVTLLIAVAATANDAILYFPPGEGDWSTISPADAQWDADKLDEALDYAGGVGSTGLVVLLNGRILAERYWTPEDPSARLANMTVETTPDGRTIEDVASAQKSVISFLIAIARDRGVLKLTDRVSNYLEVGWSDTHRDREHEITLRHIMSMTSGLKPSLAYEAEPGAFWRYNTNAYAKTVPVLETATGKDIATLTREWLTEPIGMRETRWAPRPWVRPNADANRIGLATSARDLARFGLLILAQGIWDGAAVLENNALLRELLEPSQDLNPAYGLLWWLNGQERYLRPGAAGGEGALIPTAPDDLVAAQGALGRKCYVVPSRGLVVTRLGDDPGPAFNREFWRRLMAAAP